MTEPGSFLLVMNVRPGRRFGAVLAALLVTLLVPSTASGTYPGRDGLIAYENAPGQAGDMDELDAMLPRAGHPFALIGCPTFGPLTRHYSDPAFAPDGRSLAFSTVGSCGAGQSSAITIARPDGTTVKALPRLTVHDASPQFLPSGRQLVFAGRARPGGQYDLYTVGVDGAGLRRLTTVGAIDPAPCPNGSIAYLHRGDIYLLSTSRRTRRLVLRLHGFLPLTAGLSCSPDSRRLAFVRDRDRRSPGDLHVVGIDGRAPRRLTSNDVVIGTPAFSPSGRLIALTEEHRNTRQWPKPKGCPPGQPRTYYLEVVDLGGRRAYPPVDITCNGQPGGIGWQALHGTSRAAVPWHSLGRIDPGGLSALTCPNASRCVATGGAGRVLTSSEPTGGPAGWHAADVDGQGHLTAVACPSARLCVAVDDAGNVVTSSDPGAGAWTVANVDGANSLSSVSCPSTTLCVAVDNAGNAVASGNPLGGAGAWRVSHIDNGTSYECYHYGGTGPMCQPALAAVSCPSASLCVAVDDAGGRFTSGDPAADAPSWQSASGNPIPTSEAPNGLSCPSNVLCFTSDGYAGEVGAWNPLRPASGGTAAAIAGSDGLGGVSCPSLSECFAFGYTGGLFGSLFPAAGASAWRAMYSARGQLTGIACPVVAPCIAVDTDGHVSVGPAPR